MSCLPTLSYNPALLTPFYFTCPIEGEKDIRISHVYRVEHPAKMSLFTNNYLDCLPDDITQYIMELTKPPSIDDLFHKLTKNTKSPTFEGKVPIDDDVLDPAYYYEIDTDDSVFEYFETIIKDYLNELDDEEEMGHFNHWFPTDDIIYDNLPEYVKTTGDDRGQMQLMITDQKYFVCRCIITNKMIEYFKEKYVMKIISKDDTPILDENIDEICYKCTAVFIQR